MKKLIAMIGAVAMSFCAFAATTATPGISFEQEEPGVNNTAKTFTPSEGTGTWTWTPGDPLELGAYADGELTTAGVYEATGDKVRRTDQFKRGNDNSNYLKLDTGTADLTREMDADPGAGCVDQLVKFTGFEEPQTNLTAGIGVWMSEFVTNDTDEVATTDLTETNLYVTVGLVGAGKPAQIALKIDGNYELDKWYRLTIKPIGNIYLDSFTTEKRAGFVVYINGVKVKSSDPYATNLTEYKGQMTTAAKNEMEKGQLFTAVVAGEASHSIVGYQGVGAVDDIVLTDVVPAFAAETVNVTFAPITGATITKVVDSDGNEFDNPTGAISVKPGKLTVTLAAAPGYKMKGSGVYEVNTADAVEGVLTIDAEDDFVVVVATVTNGSGTISYAEAELFTAFAALTAGDQVAILKGCSVTNGEEDILYTFTSNTTIDVVADGWDVFVGNYEAEEEVLAGTLTAAVDVDSGDVLAVTFENGDEGQLMFSGDVNGSLVVTNGTTRIANENFTMGDGAILKAATLDLDTYWASITLSGAAKVMSGTRLTYTGADKVFTNDDIEEIAPVAPDTYYTYQIASEPPPADPIVTVTVNGVPTNYQTVGEALQAVWNAEGTQSYPIEVEAIADAGLAITNEDRVAQIAKGVTITINAGSWAFSGALAYKGRIDGAVTATDVTILEGGITLGAAGSVTVDNTTALTTASFSAETGYRVIMNEGEGTKIFSTEQVPVSDKPGISFEDGEAGVNGTTFNPSQASGTWTWAGDPLEIGAYDGETLPYGADTETTARRHAFFLKGRDNQKYLKLDTGAAELARTMDAANGYVDQLMKFTGYEDIQTNFAADTKIAVWMGDICTNEETEATATNLYITVGRRSGGETSQIALKIAGNYTLDTWYRLTVKPIGNIYVDGFTTDSRAGFVVYIDGNKVGSSDAIATDLTEYKGRMTDEARTLMSNGQLFTAIDNALLYGTVAYKGIGAIDDIILTADRPAFIDGGADCTFTIAPPTGLYVVSVKNGNTELHPPYSVPAGTSVTITFGALPGWKITGNNSIQRTINTDGQEITLNEGEIEFATVAAIIVDSTGATTNEYAEAELFTAFAALTPGDQVAIVMACSVTNGVDETALYTFTSNTTIDVAADGWDVFVGNYEAEEEVLAGTLTAAVDVDSGDVLAVTFENGDEGQLMFSGDVNGSLVVTNGTTRIANENFTMGDGAILKAATLDLDTYWASITLSGAAKVMSGTRLTYTGDEKVFTNDDIEEIAPVAPDTYYTYQIAAAPGTFTVTVPELTDGLAFVAMTNGDTEVTTPAAGSYTVNEGDTFTVVYAPATGYEFTLDGETGVRTATAATTIVPPEVELQTFAVTFANGTNSTIDPPAGESNLVWGTEITVTATAAADYEFANESYEGWEKQEDGTLKTNVTVTAAAAFTAPNATATPVTVTLPTLPIDGVSSLVVSQKVDEVWEDVTATKLIGVGNEYVVVAIPAEGYTIENPIASGTAAVGTPITVTEQQVKDKVSIKTFTVTVPELVNFTVAVTNGETEVGTTNGVYTFNYASNVKVAFAAAEGYEITKDTSTNIVSLVENVMIEAPTVAIKTFTVTVNLGEDITALATNKTQGGEAIAFTQTGNFTVNYGDSVAIKYACSVPGYEPTPSEASNGEVKDNWNVPTSTKHAIKYTITIALDGAAAPEGWTPGEGVVTSNVTVETPAFTLPVLTKTDFDFAGYVKEGETATNKVVTIENTTASASYTACFTAAAPDVPVDDPTALDEKGKANATALAAAITAAGGNVNTWAATVYASGEIPAAKLNATTPAIIAIAVANDLPITANEPTFAVSASTVSADTNVAAFEFTLKDGSDSVEIKTITDKVKAMVRYTSDLTTTFHQAAGTEVAITATPVEGKIKAELVKTAANAGFMKVEPQPVTP